MKRAMVFFAVALTVSLLTVQAHAADLYPVFMEEYTYGPFDELRVDMVYELSQFDDPAGIPTEDFDRRGEHYTFLCVVKTDQSEKEAKRKTAMTSNDTVIYTATFVCQGKAKTSPRPSQAPIGQEQPEVDGSFELPPQVVLLTLFVTMGLGFAGKFIYQYIKSKKEGV